MNRAACVAVPRLLAASLASSTDETSITFTAEARVRAGELRHMEYVLYKQLQSPTGHLIVGAVIDSSSMFAFY